jgi:hypothetical protein
MPMIYLSYAREDEKQVQELYERLSNAGFAPWMVSKDVRPGEDWLATSRKAIYQSDFFLSIRSTNTEQRSGHFDEELAVALEIGKEKPPGEVFLIPVRLEECVVPERLRRRDWIDLFREDGWERLLEAISSATSPPRRVLRGHPPAKKGVEPGTEREEKTLQPSEEGGSPAAEGTLGVPEEPEAEPPIDWEDHEFAVRPERKPEPRWLQGQVYEIGGTGQAQLERALRAGAVHRLVVRIGLPDESWFTAPEEAAVPIEELPADQDQYELRIVFSEPHHVPRLLEDTIFLPRWQGNSTTCDFQFRTRADVPDFEGRVVVMYGSRILQTMLLVAQVLPDPAQAPPEAAIEFKPETSVRAVLQDLEARSPVDVALVADTGRDGVTRVTEIAGARIELRSLEKVDRPIKRLRRKISQTATTPDEFAEGLGAQATVDLLRYLARHGSFLYDGIVVSQLGDHPLRTARRIQLVSARESYLPLEFVYERPSPTADATLCPNAAAALETGACAQCEQLDEEAARAYICPMGFWCMSRVIERHAVKPVDETNLSGAEYALQIDPVTGRDVLQVLDEVVCTTSDRVQAEQIEELQGALAELFGKPVKTVADWDAWRDAIHDLKPSILILVLHTTEDRDKFPILEIGHEQQLAGDHITDQHVHAVPGDRPPVVLLLGCDTAVPETPWESFVLQFRLHGAAIVLSTLTPVLGRHAVPVTVILLNELKRVARTGGTFGDALLGLRRRALAAGIPMVLSLVSYGDADWRLGE